MSKSGSKKGKNGGRAAPLAPPRKKGSGRYEKGSTTLTSEQIEVFLSVLGQGWTATRAAKEAGAPRETFNTLYDKDERFAAAWRAAESSGTDIMEDEARRRGVEGYTKPLVYQGKKTGHTVHEHSDVLLMFMLNGRRPEKFRQNSKVELNVNAGKEFAAALETLTK